MRDKEEAIKDFRKFLNIYKKRFSEATDDSAKKVTQDVTQVTDVVLKSIDELYKRILHIIKNFHNHPKPTKGQPFEYLLYTTGGLEYLYEDTSSCADFERYLHAELILSPFTYNTEIVDESMKNATVKPPNIIS